ncbi:MAG: hypothetical protein IKY33_02225 [Clostridia bacterium]|nr:hypothetical protein [Clostridia bacterium]
MEIIRFGQDDMTSRLCEIVAEEFGLKLCGGSGYRGDNTPDILLGEPHVPLKYAELLDK